LAKARLTNLTSPEEAHGVSLTIRLLPTKPPASIEDTMRAVLLSSNSILKFPEPSVTIVGLDSQAVEIELSFRVGGIGKTAAAKNEIFDLDYRHTKAAGLQLAGPAGVALPVQDDGSVEQASKHPGTAWRLLNSVPLFATLTEDEKEALASSMKRLTFRKDTIIAAPDTSLTSLMIVRTGVEAKSGS